MLVCGVDRPAGFTAGVSAIQINGVQWYVDTADPDTTVWTAVDRPVYVEVPCRDGRQRPGHRAHHADRRRPSPTASPNPALSPGHRWQPLQLLGEDRATSVLGGLDRVGDRGHRRR